MNIRRLADNLLMLKLLVVLPLLIQTIGCTIPCGSIRDGRDKYHNACIAVKFQQHVERSGVSENRNEAKEFGIGVDQANETIELVGDRLDRLESNRSYNLDGDFIEVDQKTRFRVHSSSDLDASRTFMFSFLFIGALCFLIYVWAGRVVSAQRRKYK